MVLRSRPCSAPPASPDGHRRPAGRCAGTSANFDSAAQDPGVLSLAEVVLFVVRCNPGYDNGVLAQRDA
jgi:hypothetical protein